MRRHVHSNSMSSVEFNDSDEEEQKKIEELRRRRRQLLMEMEKQNGNDNRYGPFVEFYFI